MAILSRVVALAVAAILSACGMNAIGADDPTTPAETGIEARLNEAVAEAPFDVRLPALEGFSLVSVDFVSEPDDPTGPRLSLDVRFVGPGGAVVHVFQTNVLPDAMGETDPVALAEAEEIDVAGDIWAGVALPNGDGTSNVQLARRFGGVTLSLDAASLELAETAAAAVEVVQP